MLDRSSGKRRGEFVGKHRHGGNTSLVAGGGGGGPQLVEAALLLSRAMILPETKCSRILKTL